MTRAPATPPEYRPTLFDRYGGGAVDFYRAGAFGFIVCILTAGAISFAGGGMSVGVLLISAAAGTVTSVGSLLLAGFVGNSVKKLATDGGGAPYVQQYSYQQALVMQGRIDDALVSFEAIIAETPSVVDARIRAAELYSKGDMAGARRAAQLFREVQRIPTATAQQDVYVSNRLVDLYVGPLGEPQRALVELRRLVDRYPGTSAATEAREGLRRLKSAIVPEQTK